jgi:hypothetical protein
LSEIIIHYNFPSYRIELSLKLYGGYIWFFGSQLILKPFDLY